MGEAIPFVPVRQWVVTLAYRMRDLGDEPRAPSPNPRSKAFAVRSTAVRCGLWLLDEQQAVEQLDQFILARFFA